MPPLIFVMLEIKNIKKKYGKNYVLRDVSLSVKTGEIKALVGANGAGKSTLIEIMCGIKLADAGSIIFDGKNIFENKERREFSRCSGFMPQHFNLFPDLTVYENLQYVCAVYNIMSSNVEKVIEQCHLESYTNIYAKNLSGGYKQLLSLAAAIVHQPRLIILDEPTAAMDPVFRAKFWLIMSQYKKRGVTILLITHYLEELLKCDSFACLSNGEIAYDGPVADFYKDGFIDIESVLRKFEKHEE